MITAIREVRRAKGLTLEEVAQRCDPPTTAQTIGRLETGTRTVSVVWLNRIAAALQVDAADLVKLPDRPDLSVAATLDAGGAQAPRHPATVVAPLAEPDLVAVTVSGGIGAFAQALNRDVLTPRPAGRFLFGRLIAYEGGGGRLNILPLGPGARQQVVADPPWIACAVRLIRQL